MRTVDVRIQQTIDYPTIKLDPDRSKMAYSGISQEDTVKNLMSVLNPRISHVAIEGGAFQAEVDARQIMSVPAIFLNGEPFGQGRMELEESQRNWD